MPQEKEGPGGRSALLAEEGGANEELPGESDDDEGALMMAQAAVISAVPTRSPAFFTPAYAGGPVHLNEERATVQPGDTSDDSGGSDDGVDTGASNHMTGIGAAFFKLDRNVTGTVKFGDGSLVDIVGRDTIVFAARDGRHRVLTDVYYIPRLRSNIISLGQLDEVGCQVLIEDGVLRVRDPTKELLAKVRRSTNRLYKIVLTLAQPVSLLAHANDDAWRWHERFGHLSFDGLKKMGKGAMVRGLP
jgi:hypothetical protein